MKRGEIVELILSKLDLNDAIIRQQWNSPAGTPTRHFLLDDLLPSRIANDIHAAFPADGDGFFQRSSFRERKKTSANLSSYAPILSEVTYAMQDSRVVGKVAQLTGIHGLEPDPLLYAGGLSMMFQRDFLNPHVDNSHDASRSRYRRLNLLYYVTPNWKLENGGNLELWDERKATPRTIVSKFNQLVVMETTATSWHSVSEVQVDRPRCCVSNYFFSEQSPTAKDYFHVTSFSGRPEQNVRKLLGYIDNAARGIVARVFKTGRGRQLINRAAMPPQQPTPDKNKE